MVPLVLLLVCALSLQVSGLQLPFYIPFFSTPPLKVAIIGAGAGGSSAAFWLGKARERLGKDIRVEIYEKENYVGGRSTVVYPYEDASLEPIELGASIFVKANKNLMRAAEEFNLTTFPWVDEEEEMGIWDGTDIVMNMGGKGSWWNSAKLVWRYGYFAPARTTSLVKSMINRVLDLYTDSVPTWPSIGNLSESLGFSPYHAEVAKGVLASKGIKGKFAEEVIDSATRVNYGQDLDEIHALGALVSMAATGASSVVGGNFQLFEHFIKRSGANLRLNSTVSEVRAKGAKWQLTTSAGHSATYDSVILTGPLHLSPVLLPTSVTIPQVPYVHLHVTLLITTSQQPRPEYFGLPETTTLPRMILTTSSGGKPKDFNSLSYHGATLGGWAVKIFSKERLGDYWLEEVFGEDSIMWVHRKEWDAYPYLLPSEDFPPIELAKRLYYVNALEPWISTMETETIASRNVVELLLQDKWGVSNTPCEKKEMMRGWDC